MMLRTINLIVVVIYQMNFHFFGPIKDSELLRLPVNIILKMSNRITTHSCSWEWIFLQQKEKSGSSISLLPCIIYGNFMRCNTKIRFRLHSIVYKSTLKENFNSKCARIPCLLKPFIAPHCTIQLDCDRVSVYLLETGKTFFFEC